LDNYLLDAASDYKMTRCLERLSIGPEDTVFTT
jgi:hypothetical protein